MTVAVIGAGAAGLACAQALVENDCPVEVFEAAPEPGGRVRSWQHGTEVWELGAQVVHPAGRSVLTVVPGLLAVPAPRAEFAFLVDGAPLSVVSAMRRGIGPWDLAARLTRSSPGTVADWLSTTVPADLPGRVARAWFEQEWAHPVHSLSTTDTAAWYGDRSPTGSRAIDGVELTVPQGLSTLIRHWERQLTVHLSTPVREVGVDGRRPWIRPDGGERLSYDAVVVTVPPWTLSPDDGPGLRIHGVPEAAVRAAQRCPGGDAVAAVATWTHPAPADRTVFDVDGHGFLRTRAGSPVLQLVSKGPAAQQLRRTLADPQALRDLLRRAFGWTDGGEAVDLTIADWGRDPFVRGAFSAPTVGHLTARSALHALSGRGLVPAGEATRTDGTAGRLHGAVRSGIDAASTVLTLMAARTPAAAVPVEGGTL